MHALHDRRVFGRFPEYAAPVDGWDEQGIAIGIIGGPIPFHASEQARAAMNTLDGGASLDILARRDRNLVELVTAVAIEQPQQPILAADANHLVLLAADGRLEQRTDLTEVGVVHVVGNELLEPEELAALGVEGNEGVRVKIGTGPNLAIKVWRRIADWQVNDASLCVERNRRPQA